MTSPLDELRKALATIDRESAGYGVLNGWLVEELDEPYINGVTAPSEYHQPLTNDPFVVNAVSLYRGVVRDKLSEAVETGSWGSALLDIARAINARTEGAGNGIRSV